MIDPHRTVAWLEQQDISAIQLPSQSLDLNVTEQVWDFMGREIWSDSSFAQFLAEHHGPIFAQSLPLPSQKSKGGY